MDITVYETNKNICTSTQKNYTKLAIAKFHVKVIKFILKKYQSFQKIIIIYLDIINKILKPHKKAQQIFHKVTNS